jgi:hypothetical protein
VHRTCLAACRYGSLHGCNQAIGQLTAAIFESFDEYFDDSRIRQHIPRSDALLSRQSVVAAQCTGATEMSGIAQMIDCGQLAELTVAIAGQGFVDGLFG